jgi:hypothetical protein
MVTSLRVTPIFSRLLSSIDPDQLHAALTDSGKEPSSLMTIGKQAMSKDARRAMGTVVGLMNVLGAALNQQSTDKLDQRY